MGLRRYLARKTMWYLGALVAAVVLNFLLPRLIPGNPVDVIVSGLGQGGLSSEAQQRIYADFTREFGLDKPMWQQFITYVVAIFHGDLGKSFANYPTPVNSLIGQALPWTLALQVPAILLGWIIGNVLGAVAAYKGGGWDKSVFTTSLLFSSAPYYCLAIILLYVGAIVLGVFPVGGAYSLGTSPSFTWGFIADASTFYWLPFASLLLINIGGQAVGMRSMAIYELGSDYVNYSRSLGIGDRKMTTYIFRNAMLPQITGLAEHRRHDRWRPRHRTRVQLPRNGVSALQFDLVERLLRDPGRDAHHHGRGPGGQLPRRGPLRVHRPAHPCGEVRGEVII